MLTPMMQCGITTEMKSSTAPFLVTTRNLDATYIFLDRLICQNWWRWQCFQKCWRGKMKDTCCRDRGPGSFAKSFESWTASLWLGLYWTAFLWLLLYRFIMNCFISDYGWESRFIIVDRFHHLESRFWRFPRSKTAREASLARTLYTSSVCKCPQNWLFLAQNQLLLCMLYIWGKEHIDDGLLIGCTWPAPAWVF